MNRRKKPETLEELTVEMGYVKSYAQISLQAPENSVSRRQRCPG